MEILRKIIRLCEKAVPSPYFAAINNYSRNYPQLIHPLDEASSDLSRRNRDWYPPGIHIMFKTYN